MLCKPKHAFVLRYSNNNFNDTISNVKPGYFLFQFTCKLSEASAASLQQVIQLNTNRD